MKYGLLYYKDTDNIGDDIQSYASSQFLPRIDYLIDRENIELFSPTKKEKVKVIMNAWYVHDKFNFDISPYIEPLYVSMFFKRFPYEAGITLDKDYLNKNVIENLKENGPIGTRDLHTKKMMDELNIKNYFSGCMTLTIKKFENVQKEDYIVVVGLNKEEIEFVKSKTSRKIIVFKQDVKTGAFKDESWKKRKERVEETLRLYQGAHMVITTKLHCSLPCLALETPVLLLYDETFKENEDRIGTYLPYLNYIKRENIYSSNINFENPKENPKEYLTLRRKLEKTCQQFIDKEIKNKGQLPKIEEYTYYMNKSRNMRKIPIKQLEILQKKYEMECQKSSKLYDELNETKYKYNKIQNRYKLFEWCYEKLKKMYKHIFNK